MAYHAYGDVGLPSTATRVGAISPTLVRSMTAAPLRMPAQPPLLAVTPQTPSTGRTFGPPPVEQPPVEMPPPPPAEDYPPEMIDQVYIEPTPAPEEDNTNLYLGLGLLAAAALGGWFFFARKKKGQK